MRALRRVALLNLFGLGRSRRPPAPEAEYSAEAVEPGDRVLVDFLRVNAADIHRSQPGFDPDAAAGFVRLLRRRGEPAGLLVGEPLGDELHLQLDYVAPAFRDVACGRWLFGPGRRVFTDAGFRRAVASPLTHEHQRYLEALGFVREGHRLVKELA